MNGDYKFPWVLEPFGFAAVCVSECRGAIWQGFGRFTGHSETERRRPKSIPVDNSASPSNPAPQIPNRAHGSRQRGRRAAFIENDLAL